MKSFLSFIFSLLTVFSVQALPTSTNGAPSTLKKSDWTSIHAAHESWKHSFRFAEDKWIAQNPGQNWTTHFDGKGFSVLPQNATWTWGLSLEKYGFEGHLIPVQNTAKIRAFEQRLTYEWTDSLDEWFVNDSRGLEHGYTIKNRPEGAESGQPLIFSLSSRGSLKPMITDNDQSVGYFDDSNVCVLTYSGLKVWDADGVVLASRFAINGCSIRLLIEEENARYPLTIDPIAQQAYLKASNSQAGDQFGSAVAVHGDTVVVGAIDEDSSTTGVNTTPNELASGSGAVYIFVRNGNTWSQQAYLKASNAGSGDNFGCSVSIFEDTIVVGANFEDSSTSTVNSSSNNSASNAGAAYVFLRNGTTWSEQAYLKALNCGAGDEFGFSVSISGNTLVVGSPNEDGSGSGFNPGNNNSADEAGASYVFTRVGELWTQQGYIKAVNASSNDLFGFSVSISADTVVVGSYLRNSAWVYVRSGNIWSHQSTLADGNNDGFGYSVSISGETIVVGAPYEDSSTVGVNSVPNDSAGNSGAAYVFQRVSNAWSQQAYLKASNTQRADFFGWAVAISGNAIVISARLEDSNSTGINSISNEDALNSGAAYVYTRIESNWSQQAYLKASNTGEEDRFGMSVAIYNDTVVVGSQQEDGSGNFTNSQTNEDASNSGAAYIFTGLGIASYNNWAIINSVFGASEDDDNDGNLNGIEYVMGTNPKAFNDRGVIAIIENNEYKFSFRRSDSAETNDVVLWVETSNDLVNWNSDGGPHLVGVTSSGPITVVENTMHPSTDPGNDLIVLTVPKNSPKKFARIRSVVSQ